MLIRQRLWGLVIWALAMVFVTDAEADSVDPTPGLPTVGSPLTNYEPPSAILDENASAVPVSLIRGAATSEFILLAAIATSLFEASQAVPIHVATNKAEVAADHSFGVCRKTGPPAATGAPV